MAIRNETLKKKLQDKRLSLMLKLHPIKEELEMVDNMLSHMEQHDNKTAKQAEEKLGITQEEK